ARRSLAATLATDTFGPRRASGKQLATTCRAGRVADLRREFSSARVHLIWLRIRVSGKASVKIASWAGRSAPFSKSPRLTGTNCRRSDGGEGFVSLRFIG